MTLYRFSLRYSGKVSSEDNLMSFYKHAGQQCFQLTRGLLLRGLVLSCYDPSLSIKATPGEQLFIRKSVKLSGESDLIFI